MEDLNIDKKSRVQLTIIENHLIELYESAIEYQRKEMFLTIRKMIQEYESKADSAAVKVLDAVLDRLL